MQKEDPYPTAGNTQHSRRCRVTSAYHAAYPEPLFIRAGQEVTIGDKDSEWRGWLWCTDARGESRWVPEAYVERKGATCVALREYDATELTVRVGEELIASREESGWLWCTNQAGRSGWVPAQNLDCAPDESDA